MRIGRRLLPAVALFCLLLQGPWPAAATQAEPSQPGQDDQAWLDSLMQTMSPADKVGQLFLVTFSGRDVGPGSGAARLVQELRVGGVILSPENGNLSNEVSAAESVASMTGALQGLAFNASAPITITNSIPVTFTAPVEPGAVATPEVPQVLTTVVTVTQQITYPPQGIPLLIAVSQEGDGFPMSTLRSGFTELPSLMALGATWDDAAAEAVGQIVGHELSAVGVNLLLGPSLDVLVEPRSGSSDHLATRVFGGDPYWTGRLGRAYIRGVHLGSNRAVATVAMHLPGWGESDRSLEEEVATVDKSLQDLQLVELPPFFAVTQGTPVTDTTDALLTALIRYRGFQGNIRYVTPPMSLNAQVMDQIMAQPEIAPWRDAGGVLVSESLGVPAIRRYFSPEMAVFPHRQIALDAFLAGNDLLNLSRFSLHDDWTEQMRNIEDTVAFFRSRFEADRDFRERVDRSVRRILRLKRKVCPGFSLEDCIPPELSLEDVGSSEPTIAGVARQAATLLYPSAAELALRMPRAPSADERILLFTDAREASECELCPPAYVMSPNLLRDSMLNLYGPEATGQVTPERVNSFSFAQLRSYLNSGRPDLSRYLREADWIVFAMLGYSPSAEPDAAALKQFLKERAPSRETQKLVVFAFEAPYYLDTTEVSKLTACFGMYSKVTPFVEVAVRALFQEFAPAGQSPVTVEGVGYDLVKQLSPDPAQVIGVVPAEDPESSQTTPEPLSLKVGDSLNVRTSVIRDCNGRAVPDGTPVVFRFEYQGEELFGQKLANTASGVAVATITLEREGELRITATSEPAISSRPLVVRLSGGTTEILTPTPSPSPTPTPTPTDTPVPTPTHTPEPTATPEPEPTVAQVVQPPEPRVFWIDLVLCLVGVLISGAAVVAVGRRLAIGKSWPNALRVGLWSAACGLVGYLFYGLALPGSALLEEVTPGIRGLLVGSVSGLFPLGGIAWQWYRGRQPR